MVLSMWISCLSRHEMFSDNNLSSLKTPILQRSWSIPDDTSRVEGFPGCFLSLKIRNSETQPSPDEVRGGRMGCGIGQADNNSYFFPRGGFL